MSLRTPLLHSPAYPRVQDHLADKENGTWKPNYRSDFRFGDSLLVSSEDVQRTVEEKIKILSKRAGGGPTCEQSSRTTDMSSWPDVIMHSVDDAHADPINIGLNTKDWYRQFKPASWDYPSYHSVDGIGKVFLIVMPAYDVVSELTEGHGNPVRCDRMGPESRRGAYKNADESGRNRLDPVRHRRFAPTRVHGGQCGKRRFCKLSPLLSPLAYGSTISRSLLLV